MNETDCDGLDVLLNNPRDDGFEILLVQWLVNRTIPAEPFSNFQHVTPRHKSLWLVIVEHEELFAITSRD
jgi:hypothetical protein